MFTGIIRELGQIKANKPGNQSAILMVQHNLAHTPTEGSSVAINGVCLTVLPESQKKILHFRLMNETLAKTTLGQLQKSTPVNIELPLTAGQAIDGHFVQGHVDNVCTVCGIEKVGADRIFSFQVPSSYARFLFSKGSIALNGVSLTIVDVDQDIFTVSMMPYTLQHTTFGQTKIGDKVNFEIDMLMKRAAK